MQEYIGKTCPYCKTEFKEGDDIVLCSNCDMPHHKECWIENQGCTTFGCTGTIRSIDATGTTVTTEEIKYEEAVASNGNIFCTRCGAANSKTSSFCVKCGNKLVQPNTSANPTPTYESPTYTGSGYTQADPVQQNPYAYTNRSIYEQQANQVIDPVVMQLVGVKQEYYIRKFQELKVQNKQTTWNWPAFFVTPYWFIYRKMYGYGLGILAFNFVITLMEIPGLSLIAEIVLALFANYIYMKRLEKQAQQAKMMSEPYKTGFMQKNGGVNSAATVLALVGYFILIMLLTQ